MIKFKTSFVNTLLHKHFKIRSITIVFLICFLTITNGNAFGQFLQIESILVDACDQGTGFEGYNEMVRFRVESVPVNVAEIRVDGCPIYRNSCCE